MQVVFETSNVFALDFVTVESRVRSFGSRAYASVLMIFWVGQESRKEDRGLRRVSGAVQMCVCRSYRLDVCRLPDVLMTLLSYLLCKSLSTSVFSSRRLLRKRTLLFILTTIGSQKVAHNRTEIPLSRLTSFTSILIWKLQELLTCHRHHTWTFLCMTHLSSSLTVTGQGKKRRRQRHRRGTDNHYHFKEGWKRSSVQKEKDKVKWSSVFLPVELDVGRPRFLFGIACDLL